MLPNGHLHDAENGYQDAQIHPLDLDYALLEDPPVTNNNVSEISKWAREAVEFMSAGELEKALHCMNLCLEEKFRSKILGEKIRGVGDMSDESLKEKYKLSDSDELILLEKRCLVQMRLKMYDKVWEGAARIISKRSNHTVAFKCILASLCKTDKYSHATDVLNLWKKCAPNDLEMIEARTTVESCSDAVKNGVEPSDVFSNIEEMLGLSMDWMTGRKIYEPHWKHRSVPPGANTFVLCLQYRFGHCSLGEKCPDAHGGEELEEWKVRHSISNLHTVLACSQLDREAAYVKTIMDKLTDLEDDQDLLADEIPGVILSCVESPVIQIQSSTMKSHSWGFKIDSSRPLNNICLLYEVHRPYFKIGSAFFLGETNSLNLKTGNLASEPSLQLLEVSVCPAALALTGSLPDNYSYTVEVVCTPDVFGTFRQTVVFDFGGGPKLVRNISVEVVPTADEESSTDQSTPQSSIPKLKYTDKKDSLFASNLKTRGTWNFGNADIVGSVTGERVASSKVGFALITSPAIRKRNASGPDKEYHYLLTKENYRDRMRFFLTQEERSRQVILSKYNISAHLTICESYEMKGGSNEGTRYCVDGNIFARMTLFRDICEDTPVGRLILRNCNSILLAKTENINKSESNATKPRVYLCSIVEKTKNAMYFEIGSFCVKELKLLVSEVSSFDIQFQLDRTTFMEQKKVIDQMTDLHLDMLFPDFTQEFQIPWNPLMQWNSSVESKSIRLNPKQKEAFNAVTVKTSRTPPILIIGPFGTGKTFTLFQCIKKLLEDDNSRIMICTHSNSAADLYIKEYLDPMVKAGCEKARPLRIYYSLRSKLTVQKEIRTYCLYDNMDRFRCPTKEEVLNHRVIVVTLSTSFMLMGLDLPSDAFSHILLDEAAQAMESEAITPLLAAGENTKLVLAGDHMQLSPELFSEDANHFHSSLLERLHCLYPDSHPCKLMLCENYRSHSAIIKFASDSFYQKKLECGMNQPVHDRYYPLTFFAARGEDVQDPDSTSYYNMAEVFEVTERVSDLINTWPEKWGNWKKDNQIGVLTPYPDQVTRIRQRLRKKGLYAVSVERVLNVQGKQFRAVFLSTVRTHKPWVRILPETVSDEVDLGFFSNPKLLNTALTRAQSLVAVVGDPVSLCALGKCRRLWEDFINICQMNKSLHGMTFAQIKQNIVGVEMRLKWGLNPLAKEFEAGEFVPKPLEQPTIVDTSQPNVSAKPLLPTPNTGLVSVSELQQVNRAPLQNSNTRITSVSNSWQNLNGPQNLPASYTQYHPQGQMPVPMMPVPILMNQTPAYNPGPRSMLPQAQYCPTFPILQRPAMGYPPIGPSFIAVPIHHRSASAFAQYRAPQPPHRPPIGPPNFPPGHGHGMPYPPLIPHQHKPSVSHPPQGMTHANAHPIQTTENNPWGQPLYRTNEYHPGLPQYLGLGVPQPVLDQRQNNFFPTSSSWGSANLSHRPSGPTGSQYRTQTPLPQHHNLSQPQPPRATAWLHPPPPPSQESTPASNSNQKFSPEELIYLQRILEGREAPESIREKLTQAVSGLSDTHPSVPYNLNSHSNMQQQQHLNGLNFHNNHTSNTPNAMSGPTLSHANSVGAQYNPACYTHGDGLTSGQPPVSVQHGYAPLVNEMSSLHLVYPGNNPWSAEAAAMQRMNELVVNSYPNLSNSRSSSNSNPAQFAGNVDSNSEAQNPGLIVGWTRPQTASVPTNNRNTVHADVQPANQSSSSAFGRSYACAVKQPLTTSYSPSFSAEVVDSQQDRKQDKQPTQPKPLMEMDVDFPFPPNYSPPLRIRGNTSPAPRFRTANIAKKTKKKK